MSAKVAMWGAFALGTVMALHAPAAAQEEAAPNPEDILKHFVLEGEIPVAPLPKIGVVPSLDSAIEDVTVNAVVKRDLDLSGEFELLGENQIPDGLYLSDSPIDVAAWKQKGAEAVVKINAKLKGNKVELRGLAYLIIAGEDPVYDKKLLVDKDVVREESHRLADALIGALTGTPGGFSSQMTFIYGVGKQRRVYVMDADGHDPQAWSSDDKLALTPVFGPDHELYYAASKNKGAFKIYPPDSDQPLSIKPRGSVYGLAWNRDYSEVAASIASGPDIKLFRGPNLQSLKPASEVPMALHPAWSSNNKLAFAGEGKWGQVIHVDGKPVTPTGLNATAPVFCRHPNGVRLVYMVWLGENADIVAMNETGGGARRLTAGAGRNSYPACSPDGRLIAFFSTRKSGEGPGLYIMRIDGRRPKRISTLVGDSLRWDRLPKDGAPKKKQPSAKVTPRKATGQPPTVQKVAPPTAK
ncbi:MAG: tolB protein [Polyangiaceae bacterium]